VIQHTGELVLAEARTLHAKGEEGPISEARRGERWERLLALLDGYADTYDVRALAYERVWVHRSAYDADAYGALLGLYQLWCHRRAILAVPVPFATIKRIATGSGRAAKADVVRATRDVYGLEVRVHDIADAVWCAEVARRSLVGEATLADLIDPD